VKASVLRGDAVNGRDGSGKQCLLSAQIPHGRRHPLGDQHPARLHQANGKAGFFVRGIRRQLDCS